MLSFQHNLTGIGKKSNIRQLNYKKKEVRVKEETRNKGIDNSSLLSLIQYCITSNEEESDKYRVVESELLRE